MQRPSNTGAFLQNWVVAGLLAFGFASGGCDHGLAPPDQPPTGAIRGVVTYSGTWPPLSEVIDLRFVAMRFVPTDTADFLQLNRMAISDRLDYDVSSDTFMVLNVRIGGFFYSGIAQQFEKNILSWQPIGLYEDNDGFFSVEQGRTTEINIHVDFSSRPPFPPTTL